MQNDADPEATFAYLVVQDAMYFATDDYAAYVSIYQGKVAEQSLKHFKQDHANSRSELVSGA